MYKTETLQAFVSVADFQSFTGAANKHQQTPMAMSKQVSQLELTLGEALFIRTTRKVRLTEFGQAFYQRAADILQHHQALDDWVKSQDEQVSGNLTICAQHGDIYIETIFPWLDDFCHRYPDINLAFDVNESVIDIHQNQYDVYWGVADYLGQQFTGLKKRFLWRSQYGIYAAPSYLAKYGTPQSIAELADHKVVGYLHNKPNNVLVYKDPNDNSDKPYNVIELKSNVQSVAGLAELAVSGHGLINAAADQSKIKQYLKEGALLPVLENYWSNNTDVFIYYHQSKVQQKKIRAFIDFFIEKRNQW